jgi:hypothetical protein
MSKATLWPLAKPPSRRKMERMGQGLVRLSSIAAPVPAVQPRGQPPSCGSAPATAGLFPGPSAGGPAVAPAPPACGEPGPAGFRAVPVGFGLGTGPKEQPPLGPTFDAPFPPGPDALGPIPVGLWPRSAWLPLLGAQLCAGRCARSKGLSSARGGPLYEPRLPEPEPQPGRKRWFRVIMTWCLG